MGPYGSVGAHIKTGRSPMAQDHFKTPPDPKKGHGMTKNPQKSKKSSGVGQADPSQCSQGSNTSQGAVGAINIIVTSAMGIGFAKILGQL